MSDNKYTHEKLKRLVERIEKVKKKRHLKKIYQIIKEDDVSMNQNSNGVFMFFDQLSMITYEKLEDYLDSLKKKEVDASTSSVTSSDNHIYHSFYNDGISHTITPKLRYSNREKNLIKRKNYDDEINQSEENVIYYDFTDMTESDKQSTSSAKKSSAIKKQKSEKDKI